MQCVRCRLAVVDELCPCFQRLNTVHTEPLKYKDEHIPLLFEGLEQADRHSIYQQKHNGAGLADST